MDEISRVKDMFNKVVSGYTEKKKTDEQQPTLVAANVQDGIAKAAQGLNETLASNGIQVDPLNPNGPGSVVNAVSIG